MNKLKNCLLLGVLLFAGSVSAMDDVEQAQNCMNANQDCIVECEQLSRETQEFEKLVNEALKAEKPSEKSRVAWAVLRYILILIEEATIAISVLGFENIIVEFIAGRVREHVNKNIRDTTCCHAFNHYGNIVKLNLRKKHVPEFLLDKILEHNVIICSNYCKIGRSLNEDKNPKKIDPVNSNVIVFACLLLGIISNLFVYKRDKSLAALEKLQKYVVGLNTKQKEQIIRLFKEKYEDRLNKKIIQEKDSKNVKIGHLVMTILEVLMLLSLWVYYVDYLIKYDRFIPYFPHFIAFLRTLIIPMTGANLIAIVYRTLSSTERQKSVALQKIEAALNELK